MTMSNIVIADGQNIQCTLNNPDPPIKETFGLGLNFYPPEVIKFY